MMLAVARCGGFVPDANQVESEAYGNNGRRAGRLHACPGSPTIAPFGVRGFGNEGQARAR